MTRSNRAKGQFSESAPRLSPSSTTSQRPAVHWLHFPETPAVASRWTETPSTGHDDPGSPLGSRGRPPQEAKSIPSHSRSPSQIGLGQPIWSEAHAGLLPWVRWHERRRHWTSGQAPCLTAGSAPTSASRPPQQDSRPPTPNNLYSRMIKHETCPSLPPPPAQTFSDTQLTTQATMPLRN